MIANFALMLNLICLIGFLAAFNATLTLPGIAGIILTIGMGVDSNVLIFERRPFREELGRRSPGSVGDRRGVRQAVAVDVDSHVRRR